MTTGCRVGTAVVVVLALGGGVRADVFVETATIGRPGNAPDTRYLTEGCGGVDYVFNMGKFEIAAGQYTEFLNAVAATDPYGLYNTNMDSSVLGCQITQNGSGGSYTYDFSGCIFEAPGSTPGDWENRPVNFVSWGDAARFANWLHNGQPEGDQDLSTTEDGSYYLNGAMTDAELLEITREWDATWVIPTEDEWYKAAYFDAEEDFYFDWPTSSFSWPSNVLVDPDPGNNANFETPWSDGPTIGSPFWRTEVGAFENSGSPFVVFDQGGNVWEWNESIFIGSSRGLRGGSFTFSHGLVMHASYPNFNDPSNELAVAGFRVAEVLGPTCPLLGDIDGSGSVDGEDVSGFVRVKLGNPDPGDNQACADYGTGTLEGDVAAFVADLVG